MEYSGILQALERMQAYPQTKRGALLDRMTVLKALEGFIEHRQRRLFEQLPDGDRLDLSP